ncbi:ACT domain-containing protein, partial [Bifidobacterium thermophilum]|nr:ACT domain-containing protein [Bifidobacterium thermophilum]
ITRVTILGLSNSLTGLSSIFSLLAKNHINVDIIIQSITESNPASLSFSIKNEDLTETVKILEKHRDQLQYESIE